jgi:hypothetical protein
MKFDAAVTTLTVKQILREEYTCYSAANFTTVSYYASVVKIYNAKSSLVLFEN